MSRLSLPSNTMRLAMLALAVVLMLTGVVARTVQAQSPVCTNPHVVQPGENLFRIGLSVGVSWTALMQLNGIANPNLIYVGQVLCLPTPGVVITPIGPTPTLVPTDTGLTPTPGTGGVILPPVGVFPSITFDRRSAAPGETIEITGINFPTNSVADVLITPLGATTTYVPVAVTNTSDTGTVDYPFVVPTSINGTPLQGYAFSVMVKTRVTGYYGYNFFYNHP